jgi:hypothetical protein
MLDYLARYLIGPNADFAQHLGSASDSFPLVGPPISGAGIEELRLHNGMTNHGDIEPFFNHVDRHSWPWSWANPAV